MRGTAPAALSAYDPDPTAVEIWTKEVNGLRKAVAECAYGVIVDKLETNEKDTVSCGRSKEAFRLELKLSGLGVALYLPIA